MPRGRKPLSEQHRIDRRIELGLPIDTPWTRVETVIRAKNRKINNGYHKKNYVEVEPVKIDRPKAVYDNTQWQEKYNM